MSSAERPSSSADAASRASDDDSSRQSSSSPARHERPQLHIDTSTTTPSRRPSLYATPPRSNDGRRPSFGNDNHTRPPSSTPSLRSQKSDQVRVRFSADIQTLGERTLATPSISADEALARLSYSPSQPSPNRRQGSSASCSQHRPPASLTPEQPRSILRSPIHSSPSSTLEPQRRPTRPRGWSLRRQLFSKQQPPISPLSSAEIGLATLPCHDVGAPANYPPSASIDDVDAIRAVNAALEQARVDPPVASIVPKSSISAKSPTAIEQEATQASLPFYSTWATSQRTRHILGERFKKLMMRIKRLRDPRLISKGKGREIPLDVSDGGNTLLIDERTGRDYCDNLITSSRYTIYSFLPRQLWAQFSKIANLYSLYVATALIVDTF